MSNNNNQPATKPFIEYLMFDIVLIIFWLFFFIVLFYLTSFELSQGLPYALFAPALFLNTFLILCLMALIVPRPKPGHYKLNDKEAIKWYINFQFSRIWGYPLIKHPLFSIGITRTLFLRACDAKISFRHAFSSYAYIHEPYLITIKEGTTVGMHASIVGHTMLNDKLVLGKIHIGKNCLIGSWAKIGPRVHVGDDVIIYPNVELLPGAKVPSNTNVPKDSIVTIRTKFE